MSRSWHRQSEREAAIATKQAMLAVAEDDERFRLSCELAELYADKAQDHKRAIATYLDALQLRPDSTLVLNKLSELYIRTEQWKKAIEILQGLAQLEKEPLQRGTYYSAAASIFRDALLDSAESIKQFNLALDAFFEKPEAIPRSRFQECLKPFEAIDQICIERKDWSTQERSYRKMLRRLPTSGHEQYVSSIWHGLAEIYRSRLHDLQSARQALEVAVMLDPDDVKRREILGELYIACGPDFLDKAAAEHRFLIDKDPYRIDSYKALRKIYMDSRQVDRAWCLCAVLVYLQRASLDEHQLYERHSVKAPVQARSPISDEMWARYVSHPDEDRRVGDIFAAVHRAVGMMKSAEHKQYGLKRKERRDLAADPAPFSKLFVAAMQLLSVPPSLEVFFRPEQPGELQLASCREKSLFLPSIVVGQAMLGGRSGKDLAFPIATFLAKLRPEYYPVQLLPSSTELSVALQAAIRLVRPDFRGKPEHAAATEQYATAMSPHLTIEAREHLEHAVQRFIAAKAQLDMAKWAQAVELTSHRAGLILSGDLALAARSIGQEPAPVGGMAPKDKLKELILYASSPAYFEVRQLLGLAIA